jgi:fibronectin type 3 domain-containing protein
LSWDANPSFEVTHHYNVYRGTSSGFSVIPGITAPISKPATNSYSNTGLKVFTTYYYKVAAVDAAGNIGPLSLESSGTTSADSTRPSLQITKPNPDSPLLAGTILVEGTAMDNPGGIGVRDVYTRVDNGKYTIAAPRTTGDWSKWSASYNITTAGAHTISAIAKDKVGNSAWAVIKITISQI